MNNLTDYVNTGRLQVDVSLADLTSWRVGGPANYLFRPTDVDDLCRFLPMVPSTMPIIWMGLGSNVLVRDRGFPGVVIVTQGALTEIEQIDANTIRVAAGVACAQMARFCARHYLTGGEFWAGIPGTMGGALRMNAGCFNGETWNFVTAVEMIDRNGIIRRRMPSEFTVQYRSVKGPTEEWFIAATFTLPTGDKRVALQTIRDLLDKRARTQPTGDHSCGSVFRNPPGDYAGRLIEACGLKGFKVGGAAVSEKHANFIVNQGSATAKDIELLIQQVAQQVATEMKVQLQPEVHIIGSEDAE